MRKLMSIIAIITFSGSFAVVALAGPGQGSGQNMPGYSWSQITPEQRDEARQAHSEYLKETLALRQSMAAKRTELQTLYAQPNPDYAKIKVLADELVDLYAQLAKKRNEFMAKYPNSYGRYMGGWYHGGMMGGGYHGGMMDDFGYGGGMQGGFSGDMTIEGGGSK